MCISLFKSVFEKLKVTFSFKKTNSPTTKVSAKAPKGNAIANTGAKCNIQMPEGNINNYLLTENRNAIEDSEALDNLLECFTEKATLKLIEMLKNHRYQTYFNQNIKGTKKWIIDKFKKLSIHSMNPKAKAFVEIKKEVLLVIDSFIKSRDETEFQKKWISFHKLLVSIQDS